MWNVLCNNVLYLYLNIFQNNCVMIDDVQPQGAHGPASAEKARARMGGQHLEGLQPTRGEDQRVRRFRIFLSKM